MEYVKLNNGVEMPILGYGVLLREEEARNRLVEKKDNAATERCVSEALEVGYRLIDTASAYGNEEGVGRAVKSSGIPREDLFITTKVFIQREASLRETGYESTLKEFDRSLNKLGLDYIDLYLIHQPVGDVYGQWRAMEELYRKGMIRAIGVCNFHPDRLMDLMLHNEIIPAINQVETHPFWQQTETGDFVKAHNIQHEAWGPFALGDSRIFSNDQLVGIAEKYGKTVAQITLRWLAQRGIVSIPKSVRKERMIENFSIFDFELSADDMAAISTLDTHKSAFFDHRDPKSVEFISNITF